MCFLQAASEEGLAEAMQEIKQELATLNEAVSSNARATLAITKAIANLPSLILEIIRSYFQNVRPTEFASDPASEPASEPVSGSIATKSTPPSTNPTTLSPAHVQTLVGIEGAIFDHLFRYIKSPEHLYEAFETGFGGCVSINEMDTAGSGYAGWRAGKARHKMFFYWKVIMKDVRKKPKEDQLAYVRAIHVTYEMRSGRALSSLSKLILVSNAKAKKK